MSASNSYISAEAFLSEPSDEPAQASGSIPRLGRTRLAEAQPEPQPVAEPVAARTFDGGNDYESDGGDVEEADEEKGNKPRFDRKTLIIKINQARDRYKKKIEHIELPSKAALRNMDHEELWELFRRIEEAITSTEANFGPEAVKMAAIAYEIALCKLGLQVEGVGAIIAADPAIKEAVDQLIFLRIKVTSWPPEVRIALGVARATYLAHTINKQKVQDGRISGMDTSDLDKKYSGL